MNKLKWLGSDMHPVEISFGHVVNIFNNVFKLSCTHITRFLKNRLVYNSQV